MSSTPEYLGIDGCTGGWICAVLGGGSLTVLRYGTISDIITAHPGFTACLIDIPIGLQKSTGQMRPDACARQHLKGRASTIFPVPCRQVVEMKGIFYPDACAENERILGKRLSRQAFGILDKISDVDDFLQQNPSYKNRLLESHPELCFAQLASRVLLTKKSEPEGQEERATLLRKYSLPMPAALALARARELRCAADDILDACCLAVSAVFVAQGNFRTLPDCPERDSTGLLMQMIIPVLQNSLVRQRSSFTL